MKYLASILILLSITTNANAFFFTGNDLVQKMREWKKANDSSPGTDYVEATSYSSYVTAVYDALDLNKIVCSGKNTTKGQIAAVVAKHLESNPEQWNDAAYFMVYDALTKAFPCKK